MTSGSRRPKRCWIKRARRGSIRILKLSKNTRHFSSDNHFFSHKSFCHEKAQKAQTSSAGFEFLSDENRYLLTFHHRSSTNDRLPRPAFQQREEPACL